MGRESTLQQWVLRYLNSLPGCSAENVSGNASQSGRPDITGCYQGRMLKLELKVPDHKNTATQKQLLELSRWRRAGAIVGVCYSISIVEDAIKHSQEHRVLLIHPENNHCLSWVYIP